MHLSRILNAAALDKSASECLLSESLRGMNGPAEFTTAIKNGVWTDGYSRVKNKHTKAAT